MPNACDEPARADRLGAECRGALERVLLAALEVVQQRPRRGEERHPTISGSSSTGSQRPDFIER